MKSSGLCPQCGIRIELVPRPAQAIGTCTACGGRFLVAIPDDGDGPALAAGDEQELSLLPYKEQRRPWLEERGLRRPLLSWMLALAALTVAIVTTGLLATVVPGAGHWLGLFFSAFLLLFIALPLAALLAAAFVRLLEPRANRAPRRFWSSVIAITAGATILVATAFLTAIRHSEVGRTAAALLSWILPVVAGWVTVRLAPAEPYRHTIGMVVVVVLGLGLVTLPLGWVAIGSVGYLFFLPLVLLGAWLCVRFGSKGAPGVPV